MKIKAIVFPNPNKFELRELELPDIEDDEILVRVQYSGVSIGTERWILTNKVEGLKYPLIPGYQNVGVIQRVGKKVSQFKEGDRVFTSISKVPIGYFGCSGSHMSHVICKERHKTIQMSPIKLNHSVNSKEVSLLTMATVGYNSANWKKAVNRGDLVVVIGQGLIGQMASQHAKIRGARKVITSDFFDKRVELSGKYSADIAINSQKVNLTEIVTNETSDGADVVIESVGIPKNIIEAAQLVKYGGKMMLLGAYLGVSEIEWRNVHSKRITIYTTDWYTREEQMAALKLIQKREIKIAPLITHELNSNNALKAYDMMLNNPGEMLGVVIKWT